MSSSVLVRRTSFSSHDEDEVTGFIAQMYAEHRSRFSPVRRGARFSAHAHDAPTLGADRVRTSIDYSGRTEEGFADYVFFLVHAGSVQLDSGAVGTTATPGDVAFYPLHTPVDFTMRGFDVTTLRLPADRLGRAAEEATGLPAGGLAFHDVTPVSPAMRRYWRSLLGLVSGALMDQESPLSSPLLAAELTRTVAVGALHTFPNTTMTRQHVAGPGAVSSATVRRAVAFLEENAHRPLRLADVAEATGTGARALQYGFRRHLGTTPLGHLRRIRLDLARRDLRAADPARGDTVGEVAARWGFTNAGRFTAAYRAAHGESPHRTLLG